MSAIFTDTGHVTQPVIDAAFAELDVRNLIDAIAEGTLTEDCAWHHFLQLCQKTGLRTGVTRAWILALTRRAAGL